MTNTRLEGCGGAIDQTGRMRGHYRLDWKDARHRYGPNAVPAGLGSWQTHMNKNQKEWRDS